MFEMSLTGEEHRDSELVTLFHRIRITDGSSRLDNGLDAILGCKSHAVVEREEGIRREHQTGLAGNLSVNFINADYNKIKSIAKLEECVMLVKMNLWDNPVNTDEVKKLQDVGIIINYNPEYKETDTEA